MLDIKRRMRQEEVAEDLIVFRSSLDYSDNARVLFDYMMAQGLNRKYRIVWAVADIENFRSSSVSSDIFSVPITGIDTFP